MNPYLVLGLLFLLTSGKKKEPEVRTNAPEGGKVVVPPGGLENIPPPAERRPRPSQPGHQPAQQPAATPPAPVDETPRPGAPVVQPPAPAQQPAAPQGPLQYAAKNMLERLAVRMADGTGRGAYRVEDMDVYKDFQRQARVNADGYPGTGTMNRLKGTLSAMNLTLPAGIPIYPWTSAGGFHHPNAPEMAEWDPSKVAPPRQAPAPAASRQSPGVAPQGQVPAGPPGQPSSVPMPSSAYTSSNAIRPMHSADPGAQAALSMAYALVSRYESGGPKGAYRKVDQPWYKAFQQLAMGSSAPDGFPGKGTMAALVKAVQPLGVTLPADIPTYPWSSRGAYDGKNAPLASDWNAAVGPVSV